MSIFHKPQSVFSKLNSLLLISLAAILLSLPYSIGRLWFFAWFAFIPLFFAIENKTLFKSFLSAYLTGVIFWALTIYWLIHVTLIGQILLILYLATYFGIFGLLVSRYKSNSLSYILLASSFWVTLEYIRSHLFTGFGWALLGYSQYLNLPVIQFADIFGVYGVSFLIMAVNVSIWRICFQAKQSHISKGRKQILFIVVCLFLSVGYGLFRLNQKVSSTYIKISVVQGNIPQELKWSPDAKDFILNRYAGLTEKAALEKPDLIVWPEASSPGFLGEDDWILDKIFLLARKIKIPLLLGSVVIERKNYFNSALLLDEEGKLIKRYDKLHLVPFGEYVPLKTALPFLETIVPIGDFTPGKEYTLFALNTQYSIRNTKFAVLICFEDTIPELSRNFVKKGADLLINITNDGWYKETAAPYQHLSASVFRAVENRVPLVRSANTGVSCFIDAKGKVYDRFSRGAKDTFVDGFRTTSVFLNKTKSIYAAIGDLFVLACFVQIIFYGIMKKFYKASEPRCAPP